MRPILEDVEPGACCDREPAKKLQDLQYPFVVFGGWHLKLKNWKLQGLLLADALLCHVFTMLGRTSTKQQDWVLDPGDPRQLEQSIKQIIPVILLVAVRSCAKAKVVGVASATGSAQESVNIFRQKTCLTLYWIEQNPIQWY